MTWARAELSRLLLAYGGKSCDVWTPINTFDGPRCEKCGYQLGPHLAKHAAEQIGALDARVGQAFKAGYHCQWVGHEWVFDPLMSPGDVEGAFKAWKP